MSSLVPLNARHEVKFVSFHENINNFFCWLKSNPGNFHTSYPKRWVNNIYFDSNGFNSFEANIAGISERAKIRYRWYGEFLKSNKGNIEIKRKRNVFGWKQSFEVKRGPNLSQDSWMSIKRKLINQITPIGKAWLEAHNVPILINRYLREYFISRDGKVRITLDCNENLWDQSSGTNPNISHKNILPNMIVIELKFNRINRSIASSYLQGIPFRVSRHSKFINGVNSIVGNGLWY